MIPKQLRSLRDYWILGATLAIYWLSLIYLINAATANTGGKFTYIYDDAYIHMGIARNFVQHGVWGATPHDFTSTTSSPVWTLLVAGVFKITGISEWVPLWLNVLFGSLLLGTVTVILKRERLHTPLILVALLAVLALMPLPFMTLAGMEHILHTLLTLVFIYLLGKSLAEESQVRFVSRKSMALWGLTSLLVLTRYEGLFLVAAACLLYLLRRRIREALVLGVMAAAPLLVYGLINVANGWFLLPGSVLIKSQTPVAIHDLGDIIYLSLYYPRHAYLVIARDSLFTMLVVLGSGFFVWDYRRRGTMWALPPVALILFTLMTILHLGLAAPFIRYYPYLVAAGVMAMTLTLNPTGNAVESSGISLEREYWVGMIRKNGVKIAGLFLLGLFATAPFVDRAYDLWGRIPGAMTNLHDQQYQMGLFVHEYYNDDRVAMNDIGTTSFLTEVHLLDLVGLGTIEVAEIIVDKEPFNATEIAATARDFDAKIAIVYDAWYDIPPQWIPVGYWSTPSSGFLGSETVTFYAIDPAAEADLIANLRKFSQRLPDRVAQRGKYTEP